VGAEFHEKEPAVEMRRRMRRNFCYLLAVLATIMFTQANAQQTAKVTSTGIGYLEYLPQGYNSNTNKYPVVISLHGIKERGTTSTDPAVIKQSVLTVANVGLPKYVKNGQQYPFILISPQLKTSYGTWPADYVMQVVNHVKKTLRIDANRIYLTGLSLGGYGVWKTAGAYPEVFAAIAPVCSGGNALSQACRIAAEDVPVWAFHGDKDGTVSYTVSTKMVNAINACSPKPSPLAKMTIYPGMSHSIWDKTYKESNVLNWMLGYRNGTASTTPPADEPVANKLPVVSAGSDKTVTLPTNSVAIQGSASDPDGSIASYQWTKISGGAATLSGTTSSKLTASGLASGSYAFRLTVKDNKGASKSDDVTVTVKSSSSTAPVAQAGSDQTISTRSTYLNGSGAAASGRVIRYYKWSKVSGPSNSMNYVSTPKLYVYNMNPGTYVFKLTVTDDKGATGSDQVTVKVTSSTAQVIRENDPIHNLMDGQDVKSAYRRAALSRSESERPHPRSSNEQGMFVSSVMQERRRSNAG
jgi:hypothetical protein